MAVLRDPDRMPAIDAGADPGELAPSIAASAAVGGRFAWYSLAPFGIVGHAGTPV